MASLTIGLLILVALAIPVATVLYMLAVGLAAITDNLRLLTALGDFSWEQSQNFVLLSVPLFIMLGEITLRAGIASRMYGAVAQWLSWLPGGLLHANIGASALFAATSGSSVATIATIGTVAYPEIARKNYHEGFFLGSLAAGGTLGILIPPSIAMIVYAIMTKTSISELYMAGIIPGLTLAAMFSLTCLITCLVRPDWGGEKVDTSWALRIRMLPDFLAPMMIFGAVIGSIYAGLATPTEAAAFGVCMALALAAVYRTLSVKMLLEAFERTVLTTSMIMLIVFGALFLNFIIGFLGITQAMVAYISSLGLPPMALMLMVILFYLVLGCFMETLSMMLLTLPLVFPLVMALNVPEWSDVWFGIIMTILMELALITPPIGLNLFVAQGIRTRGGKFNDVIFGACFFLAPMLLLILILLFFPQLATWLPKLFY